MKMPYFVQDIIQRIGMKFLSALRSRGLSPDVVRSTDERIIAHVCSFPYKQEYLDSVASGDFTNKEFTRMLGDAFCRELHIGDNSALESRIRSIVYSELSASEREYSMHQESRQHMSALEIVQRLLN